MHMYGLQFKSIRELLSGNDSLKVDSLKEEMLDLQECFFASMLSAQQKAIEANAAASAANAAASAANAALVQVINVCTCLMCRVYLPRVQSAPASFTMCIAPCSECTALSNQL